MIYDCPLEVKLKLGLHNHAKRNPWSLFLLKLSSPKAVISANQTAQQQQVLMCFQYFWTSVSTFHKGKQEGLAQLGNAGQNGTKELIAMKNKLHTTNNNTHTHH